MHVTIRVLKAAGMSMNLGNHEWPVNSPLQDVVTEPAYILVVCTSVHFVSQKEGLPGGAFEEVLLVLSKQAPQVCWHV